MVARTGRSDRNKSNTYNYCPSLPTIGLSCLTPQRMFEEIRQSASGDRFGSCGKF
ncbi:MAG: hypothetical protein KGI27_00725 [Thaumarchaeota archaeon]|nr:hypothetical protein [Nitrososphaerota archaeon]